MQRFVYEKRTFRSQWTCVFLTDGCPRWCGRSVILNTTLKRSTNRDHLLSLPQSSSLTSCCSSLSESLFCAGCFTQKNICVVQKFIQFQFRLFLFAKVPETDSKHDTVLDRDQNLTDLKPLYKTMKKATFSDSEDEVCSHIYVQCSIRFKLRTELLF